MGCLLTIGLHAQQFQAAFDRLEANFNDGWGHALHDNDNGDLAWHEGYLMQAYLQLYRGTGEVRYLQRTLDHLEQVLVQRDDRSNRKDYRGRSEATWISTKFSEGEPYAWAVHTGVLVFPMADWAAIVLNDTALHAQLSTSSGEFAGKQYKTVALLLLEEAKASLAAHEDQWVKDPFGWDGSDSIFGSYRHRSDAVFMNCANTLYPLNKNHAMGLAYLALYKATGELTYRERVERLANDFHRALKLNSKDELYKWRFWGNYPYCHADRVEDISHAGLSVDFAVLCAEADIVFQEKDLQRLANTFMWRVYRNPGSLANHVDGVDLAVQQPNQWVEQGARWLRLATIEPRMTTIMADVFMETGLWRQRMNSGSILLGVAHLARYSNYPEVLALQRSQHLGMLPRQVVTSGSTLEVMTSTGVSEWSWQNSILRTKELHSTLPQSPLVDVAPMKNASPAGRLVLRESGTQLQYYPYGFDSGIPPEKWPLPAGYQFSHLLTIDLDLVPGKEVVLLTKQRLEWLVLQQSNNGLNYYWVDMKLPSSNWQGKAVGDWNQDGNQDWALLDEKGKVFYGILQPMGGTIIQKIATDPKTGPVTAIGTVTLADGTPAFALATLNGAWGIGNYSDMHWWWADQYPSNFRLSLLAGITQKETLAMFGVREIDGDAFVFTLPTSKKFATSLEVLSTVFASNVGAVSDGRKLKLKDTNGRSVNTQILDPIAGLWSAPKNTNELEKQKASPRIGLGWMMQQNARTNQVYLVHQAPEPDFTVSPALSIWKRWFKSAK